MGAEARSVQLGDAPCVLRDALPPPEDELPILRLSDREQVLPDLLEAEAAIEPLRAEVLGEDADPQRAGAVALQPLKHRRQKPRAHAAPLMGLEDVQALELSAGRRHRLVRQVARPGER